MAEDTQHGVGVQRVQHVHRLDCPEAGCDWSTTFDTREAFDREAKKIDAGLHWLDEHGGQIPDEANFGNHQCPECDALLGLDGTVSCSECGHIPEGVRAVPQEGRADE